MLRNCFRLSASALLVVCQIGGLVAAAETVTVVGTLTDQGVECPAMQGDDGTLYTLTPNDMIGLVSPGARIRVEGSVAEMSICQQGVTIEVTKVAPAE